MTRHRRARTTGERYQGTDRGSDQTRSDRITEVVRQLLTRVRPGFILYRVSDASLEGHSFIAIYPLALSPAEHAKIAAGILDLVQDMPGRPSLSVVALSRWKWSHPGTGWTAEAKKNATRV